MYSIHNIMLKAQGSFLLLTLREAHRAYLQTKGLVFTSDVIWSNVQNWQPAGFRCIELEYCACPFVLLVLQ